MSLETHPMKLLVIITEAAIERALTVDIRQLGAQGYTVSDVRGGGRSGTRSGDWDADRSIEVKVIATEAVTEAIGRHVLEKYCPHYAVTMFIAEGGVLRPQKFA